MSPRAGHTITLTSVGFLLYGGMDGRRNDQGNPAPKLSSAQNGGIAWGDLSSSQDLLGSRIYRDSVSTLLHSALDVWQCLKAGCMPVLLCN